MEVLYPDIPRIGLVVSTYGSPAYIHLHLEAIKRLENGMPVLIYDDASDKNAELAKLATEYGHALHFSQMRRGHSLGDLSAFSDGLQWAKDNQIDLLVKFSRRFLPTYTWSYDLGRLATRLQYSTYSSSCYHYRFGFRTECIALHVKSWLPMVPDIESAVSKRVTHMFVESFMHDLARIIHSNTQCDVNKRLEGMMPRSHDIAGYGDWWIGGASRHAKDAEVLWHDRNSESDYAHLAHRWQLSLNHDDFLV